MKKLLNISVIAALAVLPVVANATAADVNKQPTSINMQAEGAVTTANNATASGAPKYELAQAHANDSNVATAGYVKGAYNASIRAINRVAEMAAAATDSANISYDGTESGLDANNVQDAIDELASEKADAAYTNANMSASTLAEAITELESEKLDKTSADVANPGNYISAGTGVAANLGALDTAVKANADALDAIDDTYATQDGAAATAATAINGANVTSTFTNGAIENDATATGTVNSTVTGTGTATVAMPTSGTVDTLTTWGSDSTTGTADVALATTSTTIESSVTGSATASNVSLAVAGSVSGTVNSSIAADTTIRYTDTMPQP